MNKDNLDEIRNSISKIESFTKTSHKQNNIKNVNNNEDEIKKCFRKIVVLTFYKERCEHELKSRLIDKEKFSEDVCFSAIEKAKKFDIVNDERYAEMYCYSKTQMRYGIKGIKLHLDRMQINYYSMPSVLEILDKAKKSELENAICFLKNHPSSSKNLYAGSVKKLINRGYSTNISCKATKLVLSDS